jgi:hypothetical protein
MNLMVYYKSGINIFTPDRNTFSTQHPTSLQPNFRLSARILLLAEHIPDRYCFGIRDHLVRVALHPSRKHHSRAQGIPTRFTVLQ